MNARDLAQYINQLRTEEAMSTRQIAEMVGVSKDTVHREFPTVSSETVGNSEPSTIPRIIDKRGRSQPARRSTPVRGRA